MTTDLHAVAHVMSDQARVLSSLRGDHKECGLHMSGVQHRQDLGRPSARGPVVEGEGDHLPGHRRLGDDGCWAANGGAPMRSHSLRRRHGDQDCGPTGPGPRTPRVAIRASPAVRCGLTLSYDHRAPACPSLPIPPEAAVNTGPRTLPRTCGRSRRMDPASPARVPQRWASNQSRMRVRRSCLSLGRPKEPKPCGPGYRRNSVSTPKCFRAV